MTIEYRIEVVQRTTRNHQVQSVIAVVFLTNFSLFISFFSLFLVDFKDYNHFLLHFSATQSCPDNSSSRTRVRYQLLERLMPRMGTEVDADRLHRPIMHLKSAVVGYLNSQPVPFISIGDHVMCQ